jgi:isoamylase
VDVPEGVLARRKRQVKNFYRLLFLANAAPMLPAGDAFLQTQGGKVPPQLTVVTLPRR